LIRRNKNRDVYEWRTTINWAIIDHEVIKLNLKWDCYELRTRINWAIINHEVIKLNWKRVCYELNTRINQIYNWWLIDKVKLKMRWSWMKNNYRLSDNQSILIKINKNWDGYEWRTIINWTIIDHEVIKLNWKWDGYELRTRINWKISNG
jgi:hypothetical protein